MAISGLKERFAIIRQEFKLNVKQFAQSLNMEATTVSSIEMGKREPSKEVLYNLAVKYDVSLNWIFTGEGAMFLHDSITNNCNTVIGSNNTQIGNNNKIEQKTDEFKAASKNSDGAYSELIDLLCNYAPPKMLDELKDKLLKIKALSEIS